MSDLEVDIVKEFKMIKHQLEKREYQLKLIHNWMRTTDWLQFVRDNPEAENWFFKNGELM